MRQNISAHVDGGPSGGSSVRRHGSEDPHWRERNLRIFFNNNPPSSILNIPGQRKSLTLKYLDLFLLFFIFLGGSGSEMKNSIFNKTSTTEFVEDVH